MKLVYGRLNEKDRRGFVATEVNKLRYGGKKYIAKLSEEEIKEIAKVCIKLPRYYFGWLFTQMYKEIFLILHIFNFLLMILLYD